MRADKTKPTPSMISAAAMDLILEFEGIDQPWKWPGGYSGITLGIGYDLGYVGRNEFLRDWQGHLTSVEFTRLVGAIGIKGTRAKAIADRYAGIEITETAAMDVFRAATLPKWTRATQKAMPGCDLLPADAYGALVSLCFNRGTAMSGERRREMRAIRSTVALYADGRMEIDECLGQIAGEIRSMKRIWVGKGLNGLIRRREAEARLVEGAQG